MVDDFALLDRWRGGDVDSGNELFERHFDSIHRFFMNKCAVGTDVADLVQQTFLAALEARDRFRGDASVRTFLFAIAHHQLLAYVRSKRREWDPSISSIADLDPQGSSLLARVNEQRALLEALRQLPLDLQIALELFYWEGLRGPELATVLGVPEGTIRSRLRRGLDSLRVRLSDVPCPTVATSGTFDDWAREIIAAARAD